MFKTWQDRLPRELALAGIITPAAANQYIKRRFLPAFNRHFSVPAREPGTAFVPFIGANLHEILCVQCGGQRQLRALPQPDASDPGR